MRHTLAIFGTGALCLAAISLVAISGSTSINTATKSGKQLANMRTAIEDLSRLQAQRPATLATKDPSAGLSGMVSDSLMRSGLPVNAMSSLNPEAESNISPTLRKRTFRLTLQPIRLPDLGKFLNDWRTHHPEWRAVSMQCSPVALDPKQPLDRTSVMPAPITTLIVFESVYTSQSTSASHPASSPPIPPNSAPLLR